MPDNQIKCPSCGTLVSLERGKTTYKCPSCNTSIFAPEMAHGAGPTSSAGQSSSGGTLSDVMTLAKQGKLDEAVEIYSRITGLSKKDALESVKAMAGIHNDAGASKPASPSSFENLKYTPSPSPQASSSVPGYSAQTAQQYGRTARRAIGFGSCLTLGVGLIVPLAILLFNFRDILPFDLPFGLGSSSGSSAAANAFAAQLDTFGYGLGGGPGYFADPRAIGVDAAGNIVVADFEGEIHVLDSDGKLITSFYPQNYEATIYRGSMAVSPDGTIYLSTGAIEVYDQTGAFLQEIGEKNDRYEYVALGPDGSIHAFSEDKIVRMSADGSITLAIPDPFGYIAENSESLGSFAVDKEGNIYYSGLFSSKIVKFSPEGEYIGQMGGEEGFNSDYTPGKFGSISYIAFDERNRMYVLDSFDVQVFDADGIYIDRIRGNYNGLAFDSENFMYATLNVDRAVAKLEVTSP